MYKRKDLGTGIQNKCLEAMSVGLPIIASKQVIDGLIKPIPLGVFLIENQADFNSTIQKLKNLDLNQNCGHINYEHCNKFYSWETKFDDFIKKTYNLMDRKIAKKFD